MNLLESQPHQRRGILRSINLSCQLGSGLRVHLNPTYKYKYGKQNMFHTFMIEYFCKIIGIKRNNSQTILRVALRALI